LYQLSNIFIGYCVENYSLIVDIVVYTLFVTERRYARELAEISWSTPKRKKNVIRQGVVFTEIYTMLSEKSNPIPDLPDEIILPLKTKDEIEQLDSLLKAPQVDRVLVRAIFWLPQKQCSVMRLLLNILVFFSVCSKPKSQNDAYFYVILIT